MYVALYLNALSRKTLVPIQAVIWTAGTVLLGTWLLDYAEKALGGAAFQTAKCAVTYRKSTAVEITDMDAVVQWCMDNGYDGKITYAQPTVSKTDIAPLLKSGMAVTGAELCERSNMGVK